MFLSLSVTLAVCAGDVWRPFSRREVLVRRTDRPADRRIDRLTDLYVAFYSTLLQAYTFTIRTVRRPFSRKVLVKKTGRRTDRPSRGSFMIHSLGLHFDDIRPLSRKTMLVKYTDIQTDRPLLRFQCYVSPAVR